MQTPVIFLLVGFPGSGKTTTSKILHELTGAEHIWADHERKNRYAVPVYTHAENIELYAGLNQMADGLLAEGKSVIYDTNFNFYSDREKMRGIAAKHGARAFVVWIVVPKQTARERATQDAHKQHTRILGDIPIERFEHIARNLQPPRSDEHIIQLDGTNITTETVKAALEQAGV